MVSIAWHKKIPLLAGDLSDITQNDPLGGEKEEEKVVLAN
jgi:hypothetical protein